MPHRRRRREVAQNTLWSIADEGIVLVVSMVGLLVLVPELGNEQYGAYAALFALIGPLTAFPQSGVPLTVLEHTMRNEEPVETVARSCMSIAVLMSTVLTPVCIVLGLLFYESIDPVTIVLFMIAEVFVQSIWLTFTTVTQVARSFRAGVALRIASQLLRVAVIIGLLIADSVTLGHIALANCVVLTLRMAIALLSARWLRLDSALPGRIERSHLRSTLTYSVGISASIAHNDSDKVVLEAVGMHREVGIYAAGQRIVALAMLPLNGFTTSAHFAVLTGARYTVDQRRKALRFSLAAAFYAVPTAIALYFLAPVVPHILGSDFDESVDVIRLLTPVLVLRGLAVFPMNGLLALGHNPLRSRILVFNALFSISLYLLLIPEHSWRGAVVGTIISEAAAIALAWAFLVSKQRAADRMASVPDPDVELHEQALEAVEEITASEAPL